MSKAPMSVEEAVKYLQSKDLFGRIYDAIQTVIAAYEESQKKLAQLKKEQMYQMDLGDIGVDIDMVNALNHAAFYVERPQITPPMESQEHVLLCSLGDILAKALGIDPIPPIMKGQSDSHLLDTGDEEKMDIASAVRAVRLGESPVPDTEKVKTELETLSQDEMERRGWHTYYNPDYWIHVATVSDPCSQDYTNYGFTLAEAIKYELLGRPKFAALGMPELSKVHMAIATKGLTQAPSKNPPV